MMTKKSIAAIAAASLVATPVVAQTVSADSAVQLRVPSKTTSSEEVEGGSGIIIAILAAAAVIGGIIILADGSENTPTSP